jgi:modulator of FtsH protease
MELNHSRHDPVQGRRTPVIIDQPSATNLTSAQRVLRNTYALLALTLLFSGAVAAVSVAFALPAPGLLLTLVGYFGLLFAVHRWQNSPAALPAVFALTGFMGYTLGPLLSHTLALPSGGAVVALALASTGVAFLGLSAWVLATRRDFSFLGGLLFAGMLVTLVMALVGMLMPVPGLAMVVAILLALLSCGLILHDTSRIVQGGETNYVLATVGLYLSLYNLFSSLLSLGGLAVSDD